MERSNRRRMIHASFMVLGLSGCACAHKREVIYPEEHNGLVSVRTDRGVHVRAPFVDVHVPDRVAKRHSLPDDD